MTNLRHLLKVSDFSKAEAEKIIHNAIKIKKSPKKYSTKLKFKTLLMLFEKPSLRTRVSFEVGMTQLGGHAIYYNIVDSPLGKKETIPDFARTSSRYVDIIMARLIKREDMRELAKYAKVPVINALDDFAHPCQILGDMQTIIEKKKTLKGIKLSYFGDAHNNVTYDLMRAAALFSFDMDVACPEGSEYTPEDEVVYEVKTLMQNSNAKVRILHDAKEAAENSDVLYTDSWMSYHIPKEQESERVKVFQPFQVTTELLSLAKKDAVFMNCLPAHRGYEQTAEVIDGSRSIVFDQAENRLHIQKAIMLFLLGKL